ncbi:uncharacterized protein MELLADRAFT_105230 [Melampsora larici-populina 98AG31]|uniref:Uncharacterized protein n=1 Tax=Melampsora larici-populina (strain 98AG31 / pathotype 3-4-7) TaxID=747676 RepID=F4RHA0_MELLP|nr:uncharacterized protein MELLADRAFT_105230 [Melampsora larici-populina 98AG31]EGG08290.1 hypothetical protein MELLADRAFT_105230 [Melampsora larici-populina 98AG31]
MSSSPESNRSSSCDSSQDVTWLGSAHATGFLPQEMLRYLKHLDELPQRDTSPEIQQTPEGQEHVDPRLRANRPDDDPRSSPTLARVANLSPRAQRELQQLAEYNRHRHSRQAIRHIIKIIQDKRRDDFRLLREALQQVHNYHGRYLQAPGQKAAAGALLRAGGLAKEFVELFDNEAKWLWLQMRVDALYKSLVDDSLTTTTFLFALSLSYLLTYLLTYYAISMLCIF